MRVIILSKAPIAGKVKTRLIPQYSAQEAADLQQKMTTVVLSKVCSLFDDVWLAVDDLKHPFFQSLQDEFTFDLQHQGAGDLGSRLEGLLKTSFAIDNEPVMFLGTDSPHIDVSRYLEVVAAIKHHDVVIGPVEDGGYDLIAMLYCEPLLFQGIPWGSGGVFDKTMSEINILNLSVKVLNMSFDLDRPQDLERAPPDSW